jgi:hypothetical protein
MNPLNPWRKCIWLFINFALLAQLSVSWAGEIVAVPLVPNKIETPGNLCDQENPDFDELRYSEKLPHCARRVSSEDRAKIYDKYKIPLKCRPNYTIDHFIPLSIGGSNSPKNLWPEHRLIKLTRFHFEEEIHEKVSTGQVTQKEAIEIVRQKKLNPDLAELQSQNGGDCNKFIWTEAVN